MKKVRYISGQRKDLTPNKIYDVISFDDTYEEFFFFIETDYIGIKEWFALIDNAPPNRKPLLFENVTVEVRNVEIDEILK